jgi:hypothetical protein
MDFEEKKLRFRLRSCQVNVADCSGRIDWPKRGVYFREAGEKRSDTGTGPRIVRFRYTRVEDWRELQFDFTHPDVFRG